MKINDEKFWEDKKVFVTGGMGFIGSHLVNKLELLGAEVRLFFHRNRDAHIGMDGNLVTYKSTLNLKSYLSWYKPDVIFHLAAQPLVNYAKDFILETLDTNIRGSYNLLFACIGIKSIQAIVHISTDKVYGNIDVITPEVIPDGDAHPYNASKLSSDIIARMFSNTFDLPLVIVRNGNIYGAGDLHWERIIPSFFRNVLMGLSPRVRGDGGMRRDYIHISEIVMGVINSAEYGWGRVSPTVLRLGSQRPYSVLEVMDSILKVSKRIDMSPIFEKQLEGEIPNQHIEDFKSQELIGWYPEINLDDGLELTFPFYEEYIRRCGGG